MTVISLHEILERGALCLWPRGGCEVQRPRPRHTAHLSAEARASIAESLRAGGTVTEIAKAHGVAPNTVTRINKAFNVRQRLDPSEKAAKAAQARWSKVA